MTRTPRAERPAWTVAELAEFVGVSSGTLYSEIRAGNIPGVFRIRGRILVSISAFCAANGLPSPVNTTREDQ